MTKNIRQYFELQVGPSNTKFCIRSSRSWAYSSVYLFQMLSYNVSSFEDIRSYMSSNIYKN